MLQCGYIAYVGIKMITVEPIKNVKPDQKGRITLGAELTKNISHYKVYTKEDGRLILEPYAEIPAKELWLFEDKESLKSVMQGIKESLNDDVTTLDLDLLDKE
jgi:hypothetical protein